MTTSCSQWLAERVLEAQRLHPQAPALEVLDSVFGEGAPAESTLDPFALHPTSGIGSLIIEAFDPAMTPAEWMAWSGEGSEASLRDALLDFWNRQVLPQFAQRYHLALA